MNEKTSFRSIRRAALSGAAVVALFFSTAPAYAQEHSYSLQPQQLSQALREFGRISGTQIIFTEELVQNKQAPALSGTYTPAEALERLLTQSGLRAEATPTGGMMIVPASQSGAAPGEYEAGQGPAESANAEGGDREIVVTGSIIRGAAPSGANLFVLKREDLDATGRGTLAEAIQTMPQVHGGGTNDATLRTGSGAAPNSFGLAGYGAASLNLRGLGVEETLTLVNGRRLAPAGSYGAIPDISALPMAAVERVEILADGASATYGADAMAGVVNIIMNRRFEGAETRLRAGLETRSGQPELQVSQTFGRAFDRGNILLSADYARRDGITAKGRPYAASADLRPFGGSDNRSSACSPGNIFDSENRLIGAIPAGQDGTALTPDQTRKGETNKCDYYADSSHLTPETEKGSLYLAGSYDVTDRLRVSADVIATQRSTTIISSYWASSLTVPVSNAFRQMNGFHGSTAPLNQPISIDYQFTETGPRRSNSDARALLASLSADYHLPGDWQLSLTGSYGRYDSKTKSLQLDWAALSQALASSDPATAFNPFGDGSANSRELVTSLFYPFHSLQESDYRSASLGLSGSLFNLPGGAVKLAVGGDYRRESFGNRSRFYYANLAPKFQEDQGLDAHRDVSAAYAELFIPFFSERSAVAGARHLSVSLSGRYDHYSDFGGTFNPKAGVTWEPLAGLTLKGSYGTSFKAPLLLSLHGERFVSFPSPIPRTVGAPDANGDGFIRPMFVGGGNPDLGPEKGESWTAGVQIAPVALPGLRLHATYFNLRFTGRFAQASNSLLILADPSAYEGIAYFPLPLQSEIDSLIASANRVSGPVPPTGSIEAIIDGRTKNFASQVMDGVDAGASYRWEALGGTFNLSGDVSYLSRYKSRLGQSVSVTSYLGNVGLPARWKARGGLGWSGGGVSLNSSVNHTASYTNKMVTPHEPVFSYTTIDLSARVQLGGWARGLVGDGASLAIYVTNLLDQAPPFVNNPQGVGYDGANADPIGRRIAIQLTTRW